jgi:hypothetical protein
VISLFKDKFKSHSIPLCDGEWHRFEVLQVHDKLHIKVDEFERTLSMPSVEYVDHITFGAIHRGNGYLHCLFHYLVVQLKSIYFPDDADPNLYKGCVKSLFINGNSIDPSTIMNESISANACPAR